MISGSAPTFVDADFAVFWLKSGDLVEVYRAREASSDCPVAGFLVDSVSDARAELEAGGIEFTEPLQTAEDGNSWCKFRAPDGRIYELTNIVSHPGAQRSGLVTQCHLVVMRM